jgi:branched-chain amino acid transport system substrate-binding protein
VRKEPTNPDITDPKFQPQYRPKGKAVYFRTVTTDAYQGPNMANYLFHAQKIKSVFVLDDGGAFGVGIADSFQKRAGELGVKILGRDRLDPKEADYRTILTKIKGLNPDALYYGGVKSGWSRRRFQRWDSFRSGDFPEGHIDDILTPFSGGPICSAPGASKRTRR